MKALAGFPNLTMLSLHDNDQSKITSAGVQHLRHCPKLQSISHNTMSDEKLKVVAANCKSLRSIGILADVKPGSFASAPLLEFKELREIDGMGGVFEAETLAVIAKHPPLETLYIRYPYRGQLDKLTTLNGHIKRLILQAQVFHKDFQLGRKATSVCNIKGLQELFIANYIPVDGELLHLVSQMPSLRVFDMYEESMSPEHRKMLRTYTAEDVAAFRKARPDVHLRIDGKTYPAEKK